jgi:hypothetical protein
MTQQQPSGFTERGTDLEYDLAHDASGLALPAPALEEKHGYAVPTATPNYDGDFSYDLVHDIPRP